MIKHALFIACLVPSIASAASFDCRKASSFLEKAVCADPALSALDSSIAESYNAAMKRLSPDGQTILRDGQRQWLHFVHAVCIAHPDVSGVGICLTDRYKDRLKDLSTAAVSIGPYLFGRIDYFSAAVHDEAGQPYEIHAGAPRIDAPLSPTFVLWNSEMTKRAMRAVAASCDGQGGDEYFGYKVAYASSLAISVRTEDSEYCHGTPHGHSGTTGVTYIINPRIHSLEVSDLFDLSSAWEDYLTQRSYEIIRKKADGAVIDREQVKDAATEIHNWTLTPDGLLITFDPYVVLSYASGTTEVVVPWRDLKPFLAPNAPIPPYT